MGINAIVIMGHNIGPIWLFKYKTESSYGT